MNPVKRIEVNRRVSVLCGPFVPGDGSKRRQTREHWWGHIVEAVDHTLY